MSKKLITLLWTLAAMAALLLFAVTIHFAAQSGAGSNATNQTIAAYLTGDQPMVILLQEPDPRGIVATILARDTAVTATESARRSGTTWFHVFVDENSAGWVQAEYVTLQAP